MTDVIASDWNLTLTSPSAKWTLPENSVPFRTSAVKAKWAFPPKLPVIHRLALDPARRRRRALRRHGDRDAGRDRAPPLRRLAEHRERRHGLDRPRAQADPHGGPRRGPRGERDHGGARLDDDHRPGPRDED